MFYPDPKTRFDREYSPRFNFKHILLRSQDDKNLIFHYTVQIANHSDPNNIGGIATCPGEKFKKLEFVTGWIILYEVRGNLIEFINFYQKKII